MYGSRALRRATAKNPKGGEASYFPYELESLALVWSLALFRKYVLGRQFVVYTDHAALQKLPERAVGRVNNWILQMAEYTFTVVHQPGSKHGLPDGLSRFPIEGDSTYGEEPIPLLSGDNNAPGLKFLEQTDVKLRKKPWESDLNSGVLQLERVEEDDRD